MENLPSQETQPDFEMIDKFIEFMQTENPKEREIISDIVYFAEKFKEKYAIRK